MYHTCEMQSIHLQQVSLRLKNFASAIIKAIPPVVCGRSESSGRSGLDMTMASVLAARLARNIPYTFCPGTFCNDTVDK